MNPLKIAGALCGFWALPEMWARLSSSCSRQAGCRCLSLSLAARPRESACGCAAWCSTFGVELTRVQTERQVLFIRQLRRTFCAAGSSESRRAALCCVIFRMCMCDACPNTGSSRLVAFSFLLQSTACSKQRLQLGRPCSYPTCLHPTLCILADPKQLFLALQSSCFLRRGQPSGKQVAGV